MPVRQVQGRILQATNKVMVVGCDNDGRAFVVQRLEQPDDAHADFIVDAAGGFVRQ